MVEPRMSLATLKVLRELMDEKGVGGHYGLEISEATGVKAGSLYPILARLESIGWIVGDWENIDEASVGRRRRRYYRLTAPGQLSAGAILAKTASDLAPPPRLRRHWAAT